MSENQVKERPKHSTILKIFVVFTVYSIYSVGVLTLVLPAFFFSGANDQEVLPPLQRVKMLGLMQVMVDKPLDPYNPYGFLVKSYLQSRQSAAIESIRHEKTHAVEKEKIAGFYQLLPAMTHKKIAPERLIALRNEIMHLNVGDDPYANVFQFDAVAFLTMQARLKFYSMLGEYTKRELRQEVTDLALTYLAFYKKLDTKKRSEYLKVVQASDAWNTLDSEQETISTYSQSLVLAYKRQVLTAPQFDDYRSIIESRCALAEEYYPSIKGKTELLSACNQAITRLHGIKEE